jgi:hypothetical protein
MIPFRLRVWCVNINRYLTNRQAIAAADEDVD